MKTAVNGSAHAAAKYSRCANESAGRRKSTTATGVNANQAGTSSDIRLGRMRAANHNDPQAEAKAKAKVAASGVPPMYFAARAPGM